MAAIINLRIKFLLQILGTIFGGFAVCGQLYLVVTNVPPTAGSYLSAVVRFFSYMTIWTNILVTLSFLYPLISPDSKAARFFTRPVVQTGLLLYICIVGLVYHFFLSIMWKPVGLQYFVDILLHYVVPVLYFLYWMLYAKKGALHYMNVMVWLIYPIIYIVYILTRGALTNTYPYPFLNVSKLGIGKVGVNMLGLTMLYVILGALIILVDKLIYRLYFKNKL